MIRFLLLLLLVSLSPSLHVSAQTVGQYEIRKRGTTGFTAYGVTLSNGQVIGQTAGVPAAITPVVSGDLTPYLLSATAASTYEPILSAGTTGQYYRGDKSWQTLNASTVGLGNVSNALQLVAANNLSDLASASTARSNLGLVIGTNVQAYNATLAALASLSNASGVLTNNGSGTLSYTATSAGGNGNADASKIVLFSAGGIIQASSFNAFPISPVGAEQAAYALTGITWQNSAGVYATLSPATLTGNRAHVLPDRSGTLLHADGNGSSLTGLSPYQLAQVSASDGQALAWSTANSRWQPATISSGLTIGTTTITSGTSGRVLYNNAGTVGELTLGTGVSTALGNATDAVSGLLTYGLIGTSGTKLPLLNTANTWGAAQIISTGSDVATNLKIMNAAGSQPRVQAGTLASSTTYGALYLGNVTPSATNFTLISDGSATYLNSAGTVFITAGASSNLLYLTAVDFRLLSGQVLSWNADTNLQRDAANVIAQKNGTTAQTLRIYGTTTGSKYLNLTHDGTDAVISASSGGVKLGSTGTAIASIKRSSVTLVAGTATVSDTSTTANTVVLMSVLTPGGTLGDLDYDVSAGSSYTVNSSSATETSVINITVIHFP